ncbi:MAG: CoA-binding protein [Flavobacteriaceae bacterium]|jgi:predicted CoA-binding protein
MVTAFKTLVLGASTNPERYAYKAIKLLQQKGFEIVAVGAKTGVIDQTPIATEMPPPNTIHTVSLYIGPERQKPYWETIVALRPKRVIFNPGTENPLLTQKLQAAGIKTENACTLVLLSTNQYQPQESQ